MRKIALYVLLAIPLFGMAQQQKYHIQGQITGVSPKAKIYLTYLDGSNWTIDSCRMTGGSFKFSGVVEEPKSAVLVLGHKGKFDDTANADLQSIYLENGTVQVTGKDSVSFAQISGGALNADNREKTGLLKSMKSPLLENKLLATFVEKHPDSWVSLNWLADRGVKSSLLVDAYGRLSPALKNTKTGKQLAHAVKTYLSIRPGQPAPDFSLPDPEGKMIRLSELRGKYVFLDFWASTCKPCRAAHPKYKAIYEVLHKTGRFEILAVSTDRVRAPWVKAIADDQVPWLHVADLHPKRRNLAAELYDVGILPTAFLIDPNGIILPENVRIAFLKTGALPDEKKKIEPSGLTGSLSGLSEKSMLSALEKEGLSTKGFAQDFQKLYDILETDMGEAALANEMGALKLPQDSLMMSKLINGKAVELFKKKVQLKQDFIASNPDSFVSLYQLNDLEYMYTADGYVAAFDALSARLKNTSMGKAIKARFDKFKFSATGKAAPDFTRKNQYGEQINLSDYRGKLVLLDFWGSWCIPCRQTHPHLKDLYTKYKSKGFEIVAVANEIKSGNIEKAKESWLAAIKKDEMNWVHVLNKEGADTQDIVKDYGVVSYPTKLLLDKNGKILMRVSSGMNDEIEKLIGQMLD